MTNAESFLNAYIDLEQAVRLFFNLKETDNAMRRLADYSKFSQCRKEIHTCIQIRNLLSHTKFKNAYPVMPINETIDFLSKIKNDIEKQKTVYDECIKTKDVYTASLNSDVLEVMKTMRENIYTHVPIIEDENIVGVFSENTIFEYMSDSDITCLERTTISEFEKYLPIECHDSEVFKFVGRNIYFHEIYEIFKESLDKCERIGMIFVTENGNEAEKMLGILTVWDVLGSDY